ncbi:sulfotransferase family protein [Candidatus Neomarinimicrobiota bacterium]
MHRSGTSMVTRMLNICGLYLGREESIMPPQPDNPAGYWENLDIVDINDEVLRFLGGGWDLQPKPVDANWPRNPQLAGLREQAEVAINSFSNSARWGFKDPRLSLTLPFWQILIPNLRVIICLRHPHEITRSLMKRNGLSPANCAHLWLVYNQTVLSYTKEANRIVTHYESYFTNPEGELRRLLDWLDWRVTDTLIERAVDSVAADLRHHWGTQDGAHYETVPVGVLYQELCHLAGVSDLSPATTSPDAPEIRALQDSLDESGQPGSAGGTTTGTTS